ncbi:glycosyltransferase family 1 protein [Rothia sp. P5764]|uniref:glycosyltransferase family 1 protein n=1 Tax=Rothia sp. P5764 TaxID=3402654 RepID=UPI003ACE7C91
MQATTYSDLEVDVISPVDVYVAVPKEPGWAPILSMADLLCGYLETQPILLDTSSSLSLSTRLLGMIPRRKSGKRQALVIAYDPGQLNAIAQNHLFLKQYSACFGWVIDSFWTERIPRIARSNQTYTKIFVTDPADLEDWRRAGVESLGILQWGTDVWSNLSDRLASVEHKTTDLLRVGRQPVAWKNDAITAQVAQEHGLIFEGRPGFGKSADASAKMLNNALSQTKSVLAFSVKVSPRNYTHPTKDYITGRWLDALAWGAVVVGQKPDSASSRDLLWDTATVDISPDDIRRGMKQISEALDSFSRKQASINILNSLENFDWRHRFSSLFDHMGITSKKLNQDMSDMSQILIQERKILAKE